MLSTSHHLEVWIDPASEPITGRLAQPGEEARAFAGWIELTAAIEAVHRDEILGERGHVREKLRCR